MRFITEFELREEFINKDYKSFRETKAAQQIGEDVCNAFNWQNPINGNNFHYRLEIEAFPMDKWVEFKNKLRQYIINCEDDDILPCSLDVIKMFQELESFGKPSEVEKEMMNLKEPEYRGPSSHCKACEDEANGVKHVKAPIHTCRKYNQQ